MRKKKTWGAALLAAALLLALCACTFSSSMSYSFNVETGDVIKVTLDTSDGLALKQEDGEFRVEKEDEILLQGVFITEETYQKFLAIKGEQGMTMLEDTEKEGNVYYMYEVEGKAGTEDNFVLWIKDSKTGALLGSLAGAESAKEAFDKLTITKEEK